jgi:hypothetical protein
MFRVSVARASLKVRTSAWAAVGEKPISAMDDPLSPAEQTLKNCRLFMFIVFSSSCDPMSQQENSATTMPLGVSR